MESKKQNSETNPETNKTNLADKLVYAICIMTASYFVIRVAVFLIFEK